MAFNYVEKDTIIHRLNPIAKIFLILLFMIDAIIFRDVVSIGIIVLVLMIFVIAGRLPLGYLKGTILKFLTVMITILVITQGFWYAYPKIPLYVFPIIGPLYLDGLFFGLAMSMKVIVVVLCMPLLTMTTPVNKLMAALHRMRVPYSFVFALTTAFKFTPLVADSYGEIRDAQMMRGLDFSKLKFFAKIKRYVTLSTPLVLSLVRKTDEMDVAIEARAFGSDTPRTFLVEVKFTAKDVLLMMFAILFFGYCLWAFLTWNSFIPRDFIPIFMRTM